MKEFLNINNPRVESVFQDYSIIIGKFYRSEEYRFPSLRLKYDNSYFWRYFKYYMATIDSKNMKIIDVDLNSNLVVKFKGIRGSHICIKQANAVINEILLFENKNNWHKNSKRVEDLENTLNIMINETHLSYKGHRTFWNLPADWNDENKKIESIAIVPNNKNNFKYLSLCNKIDIESSIVYENGHKRNTELSRDLIDLEILIDNVRSRIGSGGVGSNILFPKIDSLFRYSIDSVFLFLQQVYTDKDLCKIIEARLFLMIE